MGESSSAVKVTREVVGNQFFKGKNNNSVICIVGVDHNIYRFQKWHRIKNIYTEEALEDSKYLNQLSLPV